MTDPEYEEACHRAQDEAWAKCEEKWREVLDAEVEYHRILEEHEEMLASYEAKEWMPSPEAKG